MQFRNRTEAGQLLAAKLVHYAQRADVLVLALPRGGVPVDDGMATGSTMKAAVEALRQLQVARIVVAAPTAALSTVREMVSEVDELMAVMTPADFFGVGQWYEHFSQTTDGEVCELLARVNHFLNP